MISQKDGASPRTSLVLGWACAVLCLLAAGVVVAAAGTWREGGSKGSVADVRPTADQQVGAAEGIQAAPAALRAPLEGAPAQAHEEPSEAPEAHSSHRARIAAVYAGYSADELDQEYQRVRRACSQALAETRENLEFMWSPWFEGAVPPLDAPVIVETRRKRNGDGTAGREILLIEESWEPELFELRRRQEWLWEATGREEEARVRAENMAIARFGTADHFRPMPGRRLLD